MGYRFRYNTERIDKIQFVCTKPGLEDKQENYFIMSYLLTYENGETKLRIIQEDNRRDAIQEEPQDGENPILKTLKQLAETN